MQAFRHCLDDSKVRLVQQEKIDFIHRKPCRFHRPGNYFRHRAHRKLIDLLPVHGHVRERGVALHIRIVISAVVTAQYHPARAVRSKHGA